MRSYMNRHQSILCQTKFKTCLGVLFGVSLDEKTLLKCVDMEISEIIQSFDVSEEAARKIFAAIALSRFITGGKAERKSINCPGDIADVLMPRMQGLKQEVLLCLALDTKGKVTESMQATVEDCETIEFDSDVLHIGKIFEGTLNFCTFHPREIFRFAISCNANSIVIAHNHPSGDPTPSEEDVRATKQLMEAGDPHRNQVIRPHHNRQRQVPVAERRRRYLIQPRDTAFAVSHFFTKGDIEVKKRLYIRVVLCGRSGAVIASGVF